MCLAIPGQVVEIKDEDPHLAEVDVGGVRRTVNVGLLQPDTAPSTGAPGAADGSDSPDGPDPAGSPDPSVAVGPPSSPDPEGVEPGDWVLIHVGFAISKVDEEEAQETYDFLSQFDEGEAFEEEMEDFRSTEVD